MKFTIPPEALEVLHRSSFTQNSVTLPPVQLDRKLYEAVNKALTCAGGKWSKSARCHLFNSDPRPLLGMALESGQIDKKESDKQKFQAFFTPPELAAYVVQKAQVSGKEVLEPSAGHGALADECRVHGANSVMCIEMNPGYVTVLKSKNHFVTQADFLNSEPVRAYERVVMNPPFTKNQDIKHVDHALQFVTPGGILLAIMAGNTERKWFESLEFDHEIERLPEGSFRESGTNVNTILLTVRI